MPRVRGVVTFKEYLERWPRAPKLTIEIDGHELSAYGQMATRLKDFFLVHNTYEVTYEDNPMGPGYRITDASKI